MGTSDLARIETDRDDDGVTLVIRPSREPEHWVVVLVVGSFSVFLGLVLISLAAPDVVGQPSSSRPPMVILVAMLVIGTLMLLGMLGMVVNSLWKLFGREEIRADARSLSVITNLRIFSLRRSVPIAEVRNIRWTEQRVLMRRGSYLRRTIAFDVGDKTFSTRSQLTYPEANHLERELRAAVEELGRTGE